MGSERDHDSKRAEEIFSVAAVQRAAKKALEGSIRAAKAGDCATAEQEAQRAWDYLFKEQKIVLSNPNGLNLNDFLP